MQIPRIMPRLLLDEDWLEDRSGWVITPLFTIVRDEAPNGMVLMELLFMRSLSALS